MDLLPCGDGTVAYSVRMRHHPSQPVAPMRNWPQRFEEAITVAADRDPAERSKKSRLSMSPCTVME